ncbi:hypothetical protein BH09ACT12_BH09ACT12_09080 [soil metagenome]
MQRPPLSRSIDRDGILLRRDAVANGIDDKALARLVDENVLIKMRQGLYCQRDIFLAASPAGRHLLLARAVMRLYGDHVVLSHASACLAQGGPDHDLDLTSVHLTHLVGGGRRGSRIVHHNGICLVGDLRRQDGYWITVPARSVADTVCTDGAVAGLVQANHFLHRGLMSIEELTTMFERAVNWPGSLGHHPVLHLADARIESVGETLSDHLFFAQGLPRPELQYAIYDPERDVTYRVDFAWPDKRVFVEFDGDEKYHRFRKPHETIEQMVLREKRREDRIRELTGFIVIRISWRDLSFPLHTANRIREALARGGVMPVGRVAGI